MPARDHFRIFVVAAHLLLGVLTPSLRAQQGPIIGEGLLEGWQTKSIATEPKLRFPVDIVAFSDVQCGAQPSQRILIQNDGHGDFKLLRLTFLHGLFLDPVIGEMDSILLAQREKAFAVEFPAPARGSYVDTLVVFSTAPSSPDSLPFLATVKDDQVPEFIFFPSDTTLCAAVDKDSALIDFYVKVRDNCDDTPNVTCRATSKAWPDTISIALHAWQADSFAFQRSFPLDTTSVIVTAEDDGHNKVSRFFKIVVRKDRQLAFSMPDVKKPDTLDFGRVECHAKDTAAVFLENTDICAVTITSTMPPAPGSPFTLLTDLPAGTILQAGEHRELKIIFHPDREDTVRPFLDSLVISSNAKMPRLALRIKGFSQDRTPPLLEIPACLLACAASNEESSRVSFTVKATDQCDPEQPLQLFCRTATGDTIKSNSQGLFEHAFPIGTTTVLCSSTDMNGNTADSSFNVTVMKLKLTHDAPGSASDSTCKDWLRVTVTIEGMGDGVILERFTCKIKGMFADIENNAFSAKVPLAIGTNKIPVSCRLVKKQDLQELCRVQCSDSLFIKRYPIIRNVVINEIFFDPRGSNDLGRERIELKNVSTTTTVSLKNWALEVGRKESNGEIATTYWAFPLTTILPPNARVEIHWLSEQSSNDPGNLFTGVPGEHNPFFWGTNSENKNNMTLGGPTSEATGAIESTNDRPFSLALIQELPIGRQKPESCRLVDFVQFNGSVGALTQAAIEAGLWNNFEEAIIPALSGFSYEFLFDLPETSAPELSLTSHYFKQAVPTLGGPNSLRPPANIHLLISEICVTPAFAQFIEIFNPNFDDKDSVSLADYYLTDHGDYMTENGTKKNGYINIVNGPGALRVDQHDFVVKFPRNTHIKKREYLSVAFDSRDFIRRYGTPPAFEIVSSDPAVRDMEVIKLGGESRHEPGLEASGDMVLLFRWDGKNDLVQDVDYAFWGPRGFVDKSDIIMDRETEPDSGVTHRYLPETPVQNQVPIAKGAHSILKSWQRRQNPREFGEDQNYAGGNSVTGQDEMSENLAQAFSEGVPTPDTSSGALDLGVALVDDSTLSRFNGDVPNGVINPNEEILLKMQLINFGTIPTGELVARLRTNEPSVLISDSISTYPSIAARDTAFGREGFRISISSGPLPDSMYFTMEVLAKPTELGIERGLESMAAAAEVITNFPVSLPANEAHVKITDFRPRLSNDDTVRVAYNLKNTLNPGGRTATEIKITVLEFDSSLIKNVKIATKAGLELAPQDSVGNFFTIATKKRFKGAENPEIKFKLEWKESESKVVLPSLNWEEIKPPFTITGSVKTFGLGLPIPKASLSLAQSNHRLQVATTDSAGDFALKPTSAGAYSLRVTRAGIPRGAIDHFDATAAQRFVSSEPPPPNAMVMSNEVYKMIAADVDSNPGAITASDIREIESKIANPCKRFPVGKEWLFLDAADKNAGLLQKPERIDLELKYYDFENLDFVGILMGDVNGDANPRDSSMESTANCSKFTISGKVTYDNRLMHAVGDAMVQLTGGKFDTIRTVSSGNYSFRELLGGLNYEIEVFKKEEIDPLIISKTDSSIFRAIVDKLTPGMPYNTETDTGRAIDVNLSGEVSRDDYEDFLNYLAGRPQTKGGRTGDWAFFPRSSSYKQLERDTSNQLFDAVILGNVDLIWPLPSTPLLADSGSTLATTAAIKILPISPGEVLRLSLPAVEAKGQPRRIQAIFNENHLKPEAVGQSATLEKQRSIYQVERGRLSLQASDSAEDPGLDGIHTLEFKVIGAVGDSSLVQMKVFSSDDQLMASESMRIRIVANIPTHFFLSQNYPNPFNPSTRIAYGLPQATHVELVIFNIMGRAVAKMVEERQEAGYYKIEWFGKNDHDLALPSGVYFMRLRAGGFQQIRKMTLLK